MKNWLLVVVLSFCFVSCKKTIEKAAENAVVQIMVTGQWRVTKYTKASTDITSDFSAYTFQFKENRTVDALKSGVVEKTGTWEGDASNIYAPTIYSNFAGASHPLNLLNGTFLITNSGQTFVEAKITVNGEERQLRLDK